MEKSLFDVVGHVFQDLSKIIISAVLGFFEVVFKFFV